MKITLESTSQFVEINRVPARIWEGVTDSGIKVYAFITRIACDKNEDTSQFDKELLEQRPLSKELEVYPLRLIL